MVCFLVRKHLPQTDATWEEWWGNNACGTHSIIYGSTRDHTIELKTLLSDGSEAVFGPDDKVTFQHKMQSEKS